MEPIRITNHELSREETINLKDLLGLRVLSKNGFVVGKVDEVRINPKLNIEGIAIKRRFKQSIYLGASFIDKITPGSIMLKIDPFILLQGRKVLTYEGKTLGRVKEVIRKDDSNNIQELLISASFRKSLVIPLSGVKYLGESIILKENYDVQKKTDR